MTPVLERLPFADSLSEAEKQLLISGSAVKSYKKGAVLHSGNSGAPGLFYIISGGLKCVIEPGNTRSATIFRSGADESIVLSSGVLSQLAVPVTVSVYEDCEVFAVPDRIISVLSGQNINVRCFARECEAKLLSSALWAFRYIVLDGFDKRLAAFLLDEYRSGGLKEICLSRGQIAERVSSTREAVSQMLERFAADGLTEDRRGIVILKDIEGLESLSSRE